MECFPASPDCEECDPREEERIIRPLCCPSCAGWLRPTQMPTIDYCQYEDVFWGSIIEELPDCVENSNDLNEDVQLRPTKVFVSRLPKGYVDYSIVL